MKNGSPLAMLRPLHKNRMIKPFSGCIRRFLFYGFFGFGVYLVFIAIKKTKR